ncbi:caspase family protein [Roseibium marinum]|uniref:Putative caspase-like protein n=1 Tax=Roseibium marinum TaxID=281252 RepID=A0A2S3UV76_9HYPH|nr:caspase domain-containing protein [Roseibium marinum]POF31617.1 putative caspase-like protein [Roseibium marinum]
MKQILFLFLVLFLSATVAQAERKVALVIGNSGYENVARLKNPDNDARSMSGKLTDLGFDVTTGVDLNLRDMRKTVREFIRKLEGADLALFFYAGHGLQVKGDNYLVPVDAQLGSHLDLDFEAMPANLVLNAMEQSTKVNLVFLDACRNNPFTENLARSMGTRSGAVGRGLAKIGSGVGSLISFATQPGNVALDGDGKNSPFTTALLKHLGTPGQDITRDLVMVRRDVLAATNGQQVPWDNSSLTGEVILKQMEIVKPPEKKRPDINPQIELTYWDSIKSGENVAYFETYLSRYPNGQFADIARIRLVDLKARAENEQDRQVQQDTSGEIAFWQSIQNSTRPEMFETYLDQYPEGIYARLAHLKIDAIKQKAEADARASVQAAADAAAAVTRKETADTPAQDLTVAVLTPEETPASPLPESTSRTLTPQELATSMQTELNRIGCSVGRIDGDWGNRSRQALRTYGRESGIDLASLDPAPAVLDQLKRATGRVCPLTCGRNQELKNGRCVAVGQDTPAKSGTKPKTTAKANENCPSDPTAYGNALIGKAHGSGRQTLTHPCGRKFICGGSRASWTLSCRWL